MSTYPLCYQVLFYKSIVKTYVWDIETTNLRSDIGALIVSAFGELDSDGNIWKMQAMDIEDAGNEEELLDWTVGMIKSADILIGHNSVAYDKNFINGVLARYGKDPLPKRIHLDTMLAARYGLKGLYQSVSMENLADVLNLPIKKDKPSKHDWREAGITKEEALERIKVRCIEDVKITALLWNRLKPYYYEWRGTR